MYYMFLTILFCVESSTEYHGEGDNVSPTVCQQEDSVSEIVSETRQEVFPWIKKKRYLFSYYLQEVSLIIYFYVLKSQNCTHLLAVLDML